MIVHTQKEKQLLHNEDSVREKLSVEGAEQYLWLMRYGTGIRMMT